MARSIVRRTLLACMAAQAALAADRVTYPPTRVDVVRETLHGVTIEDPYRWLENGDSPEVQAWTEAQNAVTRSLLDRPSALRAAWAARLAELYAMPVLGVPRICGDTFLFARRSGDQNHAAIYLRRGGMHTADRDDEDAERTPSAASDVPVLDPNRFRDDGTVALDWWYPSPDGSLIAYGRSESGTERSTLYLRDTKSRKDTMLVIPGTRACSIAWDRDGAGFLYTRYPLAGTVAAGDENYFRHVYYHRFGTDVKDDPKVFGADQPREQWHDVYPSSDFRWQFISASLDWARNDLYIRKAGEKEFRPVAVGLPAKFSGDVLGDKLFLLTDFDAPRYRVVVTDPADPSPERFRELIAQQPGVIQSATLCGGKLVLNILENACSKLAVYDLDGTHERDIELPTLGTVTDVGGKPDKAEFYFTFESFVHPPTLFLCNAKSGATQAIDPPPTGVDLAHYDVRQITARSKDGTSIPVFVVSRQGITLDGTHPTILYGYGGFHQSITPRFSQFLFPWLDSGGVYASACLRGGGEFGSQWHEAGRLDRKQNVFDDMAAAAEKLIADGYTRPDRLGLRGGSNGGLLMGAMLTQRPDLFGACHCAVPLLDMLRYHHFSIARLWIPEYGSAEDPRQFETLRAYSPYHHVKAGEKYPATLFTTAEGDSRVDPMHARKMAALLQARSGGEGPILLWVEKKAGHGAGKPVRMRIDEQVDVLSFFHQQLMHGPAPAR